MGRIHHVALSLGALFLAGAPLLGQGPTKGGSPVGPACHCVGDFSVLHPKSDNSSQTYTWQHEPGTTQYVLYRGKDKIGVYDHATGEYRRVNTDGTLSEPVARPWKTHASVVPPPPVPVVKKAKAGKARDGQPPDVDFTEAVTDVEAEAEAGAERVKTILDTRYSLPRWWIYAGGTGLIALALLVGFVRQRQRQPVEGGSRIWRVI